ncbi:MAG: hypothetical protein J6I40_04495 [Mailhella sp.]|nr:hypothetical protein [Mailhella sp.]
MAFFGWGQESPFAQAEQRSADQQTAFQGMKDNLPALGLIAGLSMLAHNNGSRSVGQLIGQGGADALSAYGTWQKMQEIKKRQEQEDAWRLEDRQNAQKQQEWANSMAERKFGLDEQKMAFDQNMARQRLGMEGARLALARQNMALAERDRMTQEEYNRTHRMGQDGIPYVMRTGEDGKTYWEQDKDAMIIGQNGEVLGVKPTDPAKFTDVNALGKRYTQESGNYLDAGQHLQNLYVGARQNNAAGDLAMIFSYMKMLDPTSVVREGEQASAQNAAGVPDRVRNLYNNILTGQRLSPTQRREFLGVGRDLFKNQAEIQAPRSDYYSALARGYGIDPSYVLQDPYGNLLGQVDEYLNSAPPQQTPNAGNAAKTVPGVAGGMRGVYGGGQSSRSVRDMSNDDLLRSLGL